MGKTTLAFALADLLPNARVVKLGEHPKRDDKAATLFPLDTPYSELKTDFPDCSYLVLESGAILDDPDLTPDLVVYLPTGKGRVDKPGSERRRAKADLVRGEIDANTSLNVITDKLGIDPVVAAKILKVIVACNN